MEERASEEEEETMNFTAYASEDDGMTEDSGRMETDADANNETIESSLGKELCGVNEGGEMIDIPDERELIVHEVDGSVEPYIGMKFESEKAALKYYGAYSQRVGFIFRISYSNRSKSDNSFVSRTLVCNKEGFRREDYRRRSTVWNQRAPTRVGCKAMITIRREKFGIWGITKLETKHSHPLGLPAGKGRREMVQPRQVRPQDEKDKRIRELSLELHHANQRAAEYREQLSKVLKDIDRHTNNLTKSVEDVVKNVKEIDSKGKDQ